MYLRFYIKKLAKYTGNNGFSRYWKRRVRFTAPKYKQVKETTWQPQDKELEFV